MWGKKKKKSTSTTAKWQKSHKKQEKLNRITKIEVPKENLPCIYSSLYICNLFKITTWTNRCYM